MVMFHLYGMFVGIAIVVGYSVAEKIEAEINKIAVWVIGLGLLGARIYHVIDLWGYYSQNLWQIPALWNGGMSIWGGLIGGGVGLLIYQQTNKLTDIWKMLGAIVTALPLSQAIGRVGNAVNGEFVNMVWFLPWWSVEVILDLVLFVVIWYIPGNARKVWLYLALYGLIRLVLQPYR